MSDNQRHVREESNPRWFDVNSATVIEAGDLCWQDTDDVKPASDFTWDTSLAVTQAAFILKFVGMAADRSKAGETEQVKVDKNGVKKFTCASTTFEIGALVGPAKASGNALENQKVVAVATANLAIGRVAKRYSSATTEVEVELFTFLDTLGTQPTDFAAIADGLDTLVGGDRILADSIRDGTTNHVFTAADDTKLTGIEALADVTDATNVAAAGAFMASNMNANKVFATAYTVQAADGVANYADIDTGWANTPEVFLVQVLRAGVNVTADAIITALGGGNTGKIRVADGGATYVVTAGDIIHLVAFNL